MGETAAPEGAFHTEVPNRLVAVEGAKTLDDIFDQTATTILNLAELRDVHAASMERAEANRLVAFIFIMAELIFNRASSGIPVGERLQMIGPANLAEDASVTDYRRVPGPVAHGAARAA